MAQAVLSMKVLNIIDHKIEVKKAEPADAKYIQEITRQAFLQYSVYVEKGSKLLALNESYEDIVTDIFTKEVFVALVDGIPVGSVRVEIKEDNTAYLSRFGVLPKYQNNGIGKALLNAVDNKMKEHRISRLYLHTASKATPLICCYYKRGFYIDSTTKDRGYIRALLCKEYQYH